MRPDNSPNQQEHSVFWGFFLLILDTEEKFLHKQINKKINFISSA